MANNNTNTPNDSANDNVNTQEQEENLHSKLLRKFTVDKLKDKRKRSSFVKSVNADGEVTPALLEEIRRFAGRDTDFTDLSIETENVSYRELQKQIAGYITTQNNSKLQLKNIFLRENDISPDEYEKKIGSKVDKLEDTDLELLLGNSTHRNKLLVNIYGKNKTPEVRDMMSFLDKINLASRYSKLDEHEAILMRDVDKRFREGQKVNATDLVTIFESGVLTETEKKELIRVFVPTLTLVNALNLGIISRREADIYKKNIATKEARAGRGHKDIILSRLRDTEILIPTYELFNKNKNIDLVVDDVLPFQAAANDFNRLTEEVSASMTDIKRLDIFQEELSKLEKEGKVSGAQSFKEGAIIEIKQTKKSESGPSEEIVFYGKILKTGDKGEVKFLNRGTGVYSTDHGEISTERYDDFLDIINKGKPELGLETNAFNVMTEAKMKHKAQNGEIDHDEAPIFRDDADINKRINELEQEYNARKQELKKSGKSKLEIDEDEEIQRIISEQDEQKNDLDTIDFDNKQSLLSELDKADSDGKKYGLSDGVSFRVSEGKQKDAVYTITVVNEASRTLLITSPAGNQEMGFKEFSDNFKDSKCKRISKAKNLQDILEGIAADDHSISETWKGFEFDNGSIKKKETKTKVEYDFLVSSKDAKGEADKLVQIHSNDGDMFTISFGNIKNAIKGGEDTVDDKGKVTKTKEAPEKFSVGSETYNVTAGWLDNYIRENSLIPRSLDDHKDQIQEDVDKLNQNFNLWSFIGQGLNVATVVASGKVFYEGLENFYKEGREERAARFAYSWGKHILPGDMKGDLRSRIEDAQKKRMEDYLERLKKLASSVAVDMIDKWMKDPYVKQEKMEAAVEFMLSKYGTLCAKSPLYDYKGKFYWYQALGGTVGDDLYKKVAKQNEDENVQFSEEDLVRQLIIQQCKPKGYRGVKRRSKWYKDLKRIRSEGKKEEIETGRNDGADERTVTSRVFGTMNELRMGNYPTAIGWLEKVVDKGGPMDVMNKAPFVMAFSGAVYNFDAKVTNDALKNFNAGGRLLPMTRFMSYTHEMDLLNDTILEISKSLDKKGGKYKGMAERAQRMHDNLKVPHEKGEFFKIKDAENFYSDYGTEITNALYMLNTGKSDSASQRNISKMILLEKDDHYDKDGKFHKGNETFQKYYEKMDDLIEDDAKFDVEEFMTDAFKKAGTSGMHMNKAVRSCLEFTSGSTFRQGDTGKFMWEEIENEIRAVPHDKSISEDQKRIILKDMMRGLMSGLIAKGGRGSILKDMNSSTSPMAILNKWGVNVYEDTHKYDLNERRLLQKNPRDQNAETLLNKYVEQIIKAETGKVDYSSGVSVSGNFTVNDIVGDVPKKVTDSLNEEEKRRVASLNQDNQEESLPDDEY